MSPSPCSARLAGRVAIVTGGGAGLGRAAVLRLASEGARVLLTGRTQAAIDETVALVQAAGGEARAFRADAANSADVQATVEEALRTWGRLDILFNNAGGLGQGRPLCDIDEAVFDEVLATHTKGAWLGMKHAIPAMIQGGGGSIINMSSSVALVGTANGADYGAAMCGVLALTRCATADYGRFGIRVNAICPAANDSPMARAYQARFAPGEWEDRVRRNYPRGKIGDASEVAALVAFLASDDAANLYGTTIPIDGGLTCI